MGRAPETAVQTRRHDRHGGPAQVPYDQFVVYLGVLLIPTAQVSTYVKFAAGAFPRLFQRAHSPLPPVYNGR